MHLAHLFVKFRTLTFLFALSLLAGVGISSVWGIVQFSRSAERVEHSYEVLAKNEEVKATLRSVESSARAYRLTESPQQHAEYLSALPLVESTTADLVEMTADSAERQALAGALRARALDRVAELQTLIDVQHADGATRARDLTRIGSGRDLMRAFINAHVAMETAERRVLAEREATTRARANSLIAVVVLGTLLPILLLGVMLAGLARENRRVRELEASARDAMRALEETAVHRDRLSEQRRRLGAYAGLLQSCQTTDEAMSLTAGVAADLLPEAAGCCYVMRASQNFAEPAMRFGAEPAGAPAADLLQPNDCWALRRGQIHYTGPGEHAMRCAHSGAVASPEDWTLCVPLVAQGSTIGLLHAAGQTTQRDGTLDTEAIEAVAEQLSQTVANLRLRESLRVQSLRDPLTGLYNRRYLEENLFRELQRCERRSLPLSVMMLDVDHFKRFNDEHGHAAGDALLARVGEVLGKMTRGEDIACRYGGEEFTIVLPEAPLEVAMRRAEEIRVAIASTGILHMRQALGPVSISIGVASFPADGAAPERLLAIADSALYRAKAEGRNRVVHSV